MHAFFTSACGPRAALLRTPLLRISLTLAALLAGCQDAPPSPVAPSLETAMGAATPVSPGKIAYAAGRNNSYEIYVVDLATGRSRRLTQTKGTARDPAWSLDGRIAFTSRSGGNSDVYVIPADGGAATNVTGDPGSDEQPAWTPDGTKLAIASNRYGSNGRDIYIINSDGKGTATRLTTYSGDEQDPAWSPDATKIAFRANGDVPGGEIYVQNTDGTGTATRITVGGGETPVWSPDGMRIAFHRVESGRSQIYVTKADGTESPIKLSDGLGYDRAPAWTWDGTKIAFESRRNGNTDIYVMNADGTDVTRVTRSQNNDMTPTWKP